ARAAAAVSHGHVECEGFIFVSQLNEILRAQRFDTMCWDPSRSRWSREGSKTLAIVTAVARASWHGDICAKPSSPLQCRVACCRLAKLNSSLFVHITTGIAMLDQAEAEHAAHA